MKDVDTIIEYVEWEEYYTLTDKNAWREISRQGNLTDEFIDEFYRKLDWNIISRHQKLSEHMLRKYHNYLNYPAICYFQNLSEQFIEDFKLKMNWSLIFSYQKLSDEFKAKHQWRIKLITARSNYFLKIQEEKMLNR